MLELCPGLPRTLSQDMTAKKKIQRLGLEEAHAGRSQLSRSYVCIYICIDMYILILYIYIYSMRIFDCKGIYVYQKIQYIMMIQYTTNVICNVEEWNIAEQSRM